MLGSCGLLHFTHCAYLDVHDCASALRHPNIILFMGACTISPHLCIVTELAPKGSLWGVLHGHSRKYVP